MVELKLSKNRNQFDEYEVRVYENNNYQEDASYLTDDWEDAVATFNDMAKRYNCEIFQYSNRLYAREKKTDNYKSTVNDIDLVDMSMSRADAMERCISLGKKFIAHFDKLYNFNDKENEKHWLKEMQTWLDSVLEIKLKENNKPLLVGNLRDWFFTAGANPEDFMPNYSEGEDEAYDKFCEKVIQTKDTYFAYKGEKKMIKDGTYTNIANKLADYLEKVFATKDVDYSISRMDSAFRLYIKPKEGSYKYSYYSIGMSYNPKISWKIILDYTDESYSYLLDFLDYYAQSDPFFGLLSPDEIAEARKIVYVVYETRDENAVVQDSLRPIDEDLDELDDLNAKLTELYEQSAYYDNLEPYGLTIEEEEHLKLIYKEIKEVEAKIDTIINGNY